MKPPKRFVEQAIALSGRSKDELGFVNHPTMGWLWYDKNELKNLNMDIEAAKCDGCGKVGPVSRKYYYYDIKCDCCVGDHGNHFEIVWYCKDCTPKPPYSISAVLKPIHER